MNTESCSTVTLFASRIHIPPSRILPYQKVEILKYAVTLAVPQEWTRGPRIGLTLSYRLSSLRHFFPPGLLLLLNHHLADHRATLDHCAGTRGYLSTQK